MFKNKYLFVLALLVATTSYSEDYTITQETKKESKEILKHEKEDSGRVGKFAESGNAIIFQRDGSLINNGLLRGSITSIGEDTKNEKSKKGEIIVTAQGNGVSGVGYSPYSNKNDIDKKISSVINNGYISGEANLTAGNAEAFGSIEEVYSAANGISGLALSDFGEGGIVDGPGGATRSGRRKSASLLSTNILASKTAEKNLENKVGEIKKTDPKDFYGKNNKFTLGDITNSETISGKAILKTKEGYIRKDSEAFGGKLAISHQWRTINATSTGNGISNLSYITTVDRYTYSEDKVNGSYIKNIKNSGIISGNVEATTGSGATQTTIRASVTGNGISSAAYSNNFVKSLTEAIIDKIQNRGTISGRLKAEVGNNTARSFHEYSNAIITGSANGVSVYSRSSNGQMKNSRAVIGELTNSGSISGNLYAKAGSGYGEVRADVKSSGNGVAIYTESSTKKETKIGSIDNKGMITGKAVIYGGKDKKAMENKTLRDKIFHVPLTNNIAGYSLPDEDVEADKKAVAEMKKYEKEMANELENKIAKYQKQIENKEKDILAKTPKKPEISETDKKDRDNTFKKYLRDEIKEQQNLIWSGINDTVVAEAKKRKAELEKLGSNATDDEKIKFLEEYKKVLEKRLEESGDPTWKNQEKKNRIAKINDILNKNKVKDIPDSPEILALKKEKAELEKELAKVMDEKKKSDHLAANIHTETGVVASGNGISINDGKEDGVVLGSLKNSGVISGETEIHHGNSQRKYSRIAHKNSGAGIAVGGNVEGKIENTGIISGTEFALLAKGKRNDAYGIDKENVTYESGFKGGVDNYGILAGRIIIGGYQSAHTGSHGEWGKIEEEYGYFETIYKDKKHYNNKGIFLVLDRNGEVRKVIGEDKETIHNGRTVKNVLDINGTYEGDTSNKIINGVGKDGVVVAKENQNKNIENSIINGFKNAIKVKKNGLVKISNSTINANGFGKSYAILGDEGANEVEITNKSIINGKIDLGAGDDRLTLSGNYRLNREVDLGTGNNTLAFGKKENGIRSTSSYSTFGASSTNTSVFNGTVNNANKVEVNENTAFSSNSRINGVNELNLANGKTLDYYFVDKENQAFAELAKSNRNLKVKGSGKVNLVPIGSKVQIGYEKDLLGFSFGNNLLKPNSNGGTTLPSNNGRMTPPSNNPRNNTPGNRGGFFIDPRLTPFDRYSKGAFDAYIADYKSTGIDFLKDYKSSQEVFKNYLYNLTNNNPVGYLKDSAIDTVLAYHKANTNSNFTKKGQITVSGEIFNIRNKYYENNKVVSNGASAEISYGTSDNTNIGLNIGGGQSKVKTSNENLKSEVLVLGVNAEYKVKNFSWKNEVSYGRIKPKKYSALDTYSLYSQLGYNIPLSETWSLTPKVSVFLSKVKQKEMTVNNIKVAKDDDTFVETTVGTELNKKFMFGNNGINFGLGVDYSMVKDLDDSKAHFVGGSTEFDLRNYDRKNRATAEIKFGYEHISGITATFRIRKNKDITSSGFGLGYKF
ncbi:autotransporter domain-containing protein [Fusobacterium nucleatum subsp. nucleatum ATCC 23726]|uniref:Autotransporter beta-domain protein n=1 Tax=Fusobacterium nucleatum subsp. nucleatum (strain ATCC 23726 / VPI 4351) TaxID=525283 RepID=D5REX7_FUSN2|nr:autotransporter outer membrane beta-barrel domain-containing protein [Fusobacterium nucleatum]EFG94596.1 autotransporter beta-domain protein [Fusobacterium nucleatum subsp. nucleatum ATCC 23726]